MCGRDNHNLSDCRTYQRAMKLKEYVSSSLPVGSDPQREDNGLADSLFVVVQEAQVSMKASSNNRADVNISAHVHISEHKKHSTLSNNSLKYKKEILDLLKTMKIEILDDADAEEIRTSLTPLNQNLPDKRSEKQRRSQQHCTYCKKAGHEQNICPKKANLSHESDKDSPEKRFIKQLLTTENRQASPKKSDLEGTILDWKDRGAQMNKNNPWIARSNTSHVDRIRAHLGYWKAMDCSKTVLSWLANGLQVKFEVEPPRVRFPPTKSQEQHSEFVHEEVLKHIKDGSFDVATTRYAAIINPIIVEDNGKKLRMCVDTRFPNAFLPAPKFKNETIDIVVTSLLKKNDLMVTTDISKAYYCIPLHESVRKYFCFEHASLIICPKILIFGLNEAPFFFNKILRQVVRFCRSIGIRMSAYFDDLIWFAISQKEADILVPILKEIMTNLGWLLNEKARLTPTRQAEHLGWLINSESMTLHRSQSKIEEVKGMIEAIIKETTTNLLNLASIAGKLQASRLAIPAAGLWTSDLYKCISRHSRQSWADRPIEIDRRAKKELEFWRKNVVRLNQQGTQITHEMVQATLTCDASDKGWGAVFTEAGVMKTLAGHLSETDKQKSSTFRELVGVREALKQITTDRPQSRIKVYLDSQAGVYIIQKGYSRTTEINDLLKKMWLENDKKGTQLEIQWIPRSENKQADYLSRLSMPITEKDRALVRIALSEQKIETKAWTFATGTKGWHVCRPDMNYITGAIALLRHSASKGVILTQKWLSQIWWPTVINESVFTVDLRDDLILCAFDFSSQS